MKRRYPAPRLPRPVTDEHLVWAHEVVTEHELGPCGECQPHSCERLGDARILLTIRRRRWQSPEVYRKGMHPDRLDLALSLRAKGLTWNDIAAVFRARWNLSAMVAMRLAHGWSQRDAADAWCKQWPDDPKTFKNFSYWEVWPARTGYAPSLPVLMRLAELYECAVTDLLADVGDFRDRDEAHRSPALFSYCGFCGEYRLADSAAGGGGPVDAARPTRRGPTPSD